jgi:hypothetical protein
VRRVNPLRGTRLHDCTTARLHDCTTARLHDCTTARLHDCTTARTSVTRAEPAPGCSAPTAGW